MFSFDHITEATFDVRPANLPDGAKLSERMRDGKVQYVVHLTERLTVPTTETDLRQIAADESVETSLDCGGTKVKMTQACADYVRGRKLRSNQDMQQVLRGGGATERRGDALAWWSKVDGQSDVAMASLIKAMRDRAYAKEHNAKLDRISAALLNKDEQTARAEIGL